MRDIVVATHNPAKLAQFRRLLAGLPLRPVQPPPNVDVRVEERGETFLDNAARKARAWAQATCQAAIASDGGLDIPALGEDWRALTTRRATGPDAPDTEATDAERIARLLAVAADLRGEDRRVCWTEAVAIATPAALVGAWQASGAPGVLADAPAPPNALAGFWVDRLRLYPALGKYHSQLSAEERASIGDPWIALRATLEEALGESALGRV